MPNAPRRFTTLMAGGLLAITAAVPGAAAQPSARRIAVLDFSNGTLVNPAAVEPLRRALGATLAGALARTGQAQVIERNRLHELLAEQDLAATGRLDDATAARVGRLLGVEYLLAGAFLVQPNREIVISTRLVDVATGTVSAGPELVGDTRRVTTLMTQLSSRVAKTLALPPVPTSRDDSRVKDSPELSAALDRLARACDQRQPAAVDSARSVITQQAPGHPALAAPCLR